MAEYSNISFPTSEDESLKTSIRKGGQVIVTFPGDYSTVSSGGTTTTTWYKLQGLTDDLITHVTWESTNKTSDHPSVAITERSIITSWYIITSA